MTTARAIQGAEELDFRTSIEALFVEALKHDMTPELRERLKAIGIDLDNLRPAYPRMIFSAGCRAAVDVLYPGMQTEEGLRLLGRRLIEGYSKTLLGSAVMAVFKLIGVRRGLDRLTRAFRNGDNYTETKFTILEPGKVDVHFNQVNGQPAFTRGMLEACMDWVGAKDARVFPLREEGPGCVYRMTWLER